MTGVRLERVFRLVALTFLYGITAALVVNLFITRWGFRDTDPRFNFEKVITYSADRPFVYRVLVPALVNGLTYATPAPVREFVDAMSSPAPPEGSPEAAAESEHLRVLRIEYRSMREQFGWSEGLALERLYAYFLLFGCAVLLQVVLRKLAAEFFELPAAHLDAAPVAAMLFLPLTFQQGGYVFDFPELLLVTSSFLLLARRQWVRYYCVFALAVLNKESSILLVVGPWALYWREYSLRGHLLHTLAHLVPAAIIMLGVNHVFQGNPGSPMEWHLVDNYWYFKRPRSYLAIDDIYAPLIWFPVFFNIVLVALTLFATTYRWKEKPRSLRILIAVYMAVLVPLFITGGWRNEVRVFDVAGPALYLLVLHTLQYVYAGRGPDRHWPASPS